MDNYETEEQQVEAIKKWLSENYKMVVFFAIVGLSGIVGVQQWKQNKTQNAQNASMKYDNVMQAVKTKQSETIAPQVEAIISEYPDYPYASLAAMLEAKQLTEADKLAEAGDKLQWVIEHTKAQNLQHIARVRLASLLSAQGKNEQALKILDVEQGSFKASYLEAKGDVLVALKRIDEARSAYDQALESFAAIGANAQILRIKRNDLGNS